MELDHVIQPMRIDGFLASITRAFFTNDQHSVVVSPLLLSVHAF